MLNSSLTNEEMREKIIALEKENTAYEQRLIALRSGDRKVDPVEKVKVDKFYDLYSKEWKLRKRMVLTFSRLFLYSIV